MFWTKLPSKETLEKELAGLDKALELLNKRYEEKTIDIESFKQQCEKMAEKRKKILKQLEKYN